MLQNIIEKLAKVSFWRYVIFFTLLAIILSETLMVVQSYFLTGDFFDRNLMIVGFITPAIDAFIVFVFSGLILQYVTKLKEEIKNEQELAINFFETSSTLMVALNQEGNITKINQSGANLLGYEREELIGQNWFKRCLPQPEGSEMVYPLFLDMLSGRVDMVKRYENAIICKDGTLRDIAWNNSFMQSSEGEITGIISSGEDITALRQHQHRLEELNKNLEKEVALQLEEIRNKDQMMLQQSKMAAMGEMIGSIAHQWRQPLTALSLNKDLLVDDYRHGELDDEKISTFDQNVTRTVNYMSDTIDDFRNFFQPSKDSKAFNIVEATHKSSEMVMSQLKNHSISLKINSTEKIVTIDGFENEYRQVVLNLINNAKDAILKQQGELEIKGCIEINLIKQDEEVQVSVADNGGGIPTQIISRIFEPYFTTKFQSQGTGIGLYMAKTIIEDNMHGRIEVTSSPLGTTFILALPLNETSSDSDEK
jgi:PAS domain S-box-containing protein